MVSEVDKYIHLPYLGITSEFINYLFFVHETEQLNHLSMAFSSKEVFYKLQNAPPTTRIQK